MLHFVERKPPKSCGRIEYQTSIILVYTATICHILLWLFLCKIKAILKGLVRTDEKCTFG